MGAKPMPIVRYRQALAENLVGGVWNPRRRSHPGSAERD
jgi:hypothetical protein